MATEWLTFKTFGQLPVWKTLQQAVPNKCQKWRLTQVWRLLGFLLHSHPTELEHSFLSLTRWHQLVRHAKLTDTGTTLVRRCGPQALSLIETSQRPISTDGCHMYANKEQSESRSPISTTCLPHTAPPNAPHPQSVYAHSH